MLRCLRSLTSWIGRLETVVLSVPKLSSYVPS